MAGERGHAREHVIQRCEGLVGIVHATMVEQQPQRRQLHALSGQWLVDFMGEGGRHLPQCRQLGRLHQAILGGAQRLGAFFDQLLQLFSAALAQAGQAPTLAEKQHQKHQGQPRTRSGKARVTLVFKGKLGFAQQVQGPAFALERQRLPDVIGVAVGAVDADQVAVFVKALQGLGVQGLQLLLVVLAGGLEFGQVIFGQRPQVAITPARLVGDKHDAPRIADQQQVIALGPFALQLGELQLDHHGAEELLVLIHDRAGKKVARNARSHPHRIKAPGALAQGLAEIRPERVIVADITAGQVPVAGGHGQAGAVHQFQGRRLRGAVDTLQLAVEPVLRGGVQRALQGADHFRVQRQHGRQGTVAFDQGVQRVGVQRELLIGTGGVVHQGLAFGMARGQGGGQHRTGDDQQGIERQAQGARDHDHTMMNRHGKGRAP